MAHTTVIEQRLGAMRTLAGLLIAHLEDSGLIDRAVLQADLALILEQSDLADTVAADISHVFGTADVMRTGWASQRALTCG